LVNCEINKVSLLKVSLGDKHVLSLLELHSFHKVVDVRLDKNYLEYLQSNLFGLEYGLA
jgi:hypothetical protein